jgi:tRNA(Ile)-lysidine synthase
MRADADALDALAADAHAAASVADGGLDVLRLAALPPALRTRVIRRAALAAGCPASDLAAVHVFAVDRLVTSWHGQERLDLPGGVGVTRTGGTLSFVRAGPSPRPPAVPER